MSLVCLSKEFIKQVRKKKKERRVKEKGKVTYAPLV